MSSSHSQSETQPEPAMPSSCSIPTCTICKEPITTDLARFIPCTHEFHSVCAIQVLIHSEGVVGRRCPNCRARLEEVRYAFTPEGQYTSLPVGAANSEEYDGGLPATPHATMSGMRVNYTQFSIRDQEVLPLGLSDAERDNAEYGLPNSRRPPIWYSPLWEEIYLRVTDEGHDHRVTITRKLSLRMEQDETRQRTSSYMLDELIIKEVPPNSPEPVEESVLSGSQRVTEELWSAFHQRNGGVVRTGREYDAFNLIWIADDRNITSCVRQVERTLQDCQGQGQVTCIQTATMLTEFHPREMEMLALNIGGGSRYEQTKIEEKRAEVRCALMWLTRHEDRSRYCIDRAKTGLLERGLGNICAHCDQWHGQGEFPWDQPDRRGMTVTLPETMTSLLSDGALFDAEHIFDRDWPPL